jgi:Ca2+-binding RTX toxin-like protein
MTANIRIHATGGSNIIAFSTAVLDDIEKAKFSATEIIITGTNGDRFNLVGNFEYSGSPSLNTLTGGNVTSVRLVENGDESYASLGGINIDALAAIDALFNESAEEFFALLGPVYFYGNAGGDTAFAGEFNDHLFGKKGNDILGGFDGNDLVEGGAGSDQMQGGNGKDMLSYKHSPQGVTVSLNGTASGGDAAGDVFAGFENLTGSAKNDTLGGDGQNNILNGGLGNDTLAGLAGGDKLIGKNGLDTADYADSNAGVTVNLETGQAAGGHAAGDTLSRIENLTGSTLADTLTGDGLANVLMGAQGNDTLNGGGNADSLDGGEGNDRINGGSAHDSLLGRAGKDVFVMSDAAANSDDIGDFDADDDSLEIDASVFGGGLVAGVNLTAAQVQVNATGEATTAAARFILNSVTGELFFDSNGSAQDTGSRLIAVLDGSLGGFNHTNFDII